MGDQHVRAGFYQAGFSVSLSELDHTLFTHLIYLSFSPLGDHIAPAHLRDDDLHHAATFALSISPSTKALLAMPFYSRPPDHPDLLASSIEIAREHHFDGVHFTLGSINEEFLQFCSRWREAAAQESRQTCRRGLLLTASFYRWSSQLTMRRGVPFPLDWICLRGYDQGVDLAVSSRKRRPHLNPPLSTFAHSPLHNCKPGWSIHLSIRTCLDAGLDPSALVLGIAMHGYCFHLKDPSLHGMHAPCVVPEYGRRGAIAANSDRRAIARRKLPPHSEFGGVTYRDLVEFIGQHKAKCCHDSTTHSAYCFVGTTWIAYDDTFTVSQKVDYIKSMGLKGYALDSLHEDTPNWQLSHAARSSLLADVESKQITSNDKGKQLKGKLKVQSRTRKEIIELGVHLSSR